MNYYNDNDPFAADWLRGLIDAGLIPRGEVNEASIQDPPWGAAYRATQAHFFAGIGGWPLALRLAGWPDDEPVWTASLPCQPWSAAGKGLGEADERHLWPGFKKLVARGRPAVILGEQVASSAGRAWLARVRADLEALGYRFAAADLCSASVRSPNIRQRLFWVADLPGDRLQGRGQAAPQGRLEQPDDVPARRGLAQDAPGQRRRGRRDEDTARHEGQVQAEGLCPDCSRLEHAEGDGREQRGTEPGGRGAPGRRGQRRLAHADGGEPGDGGLQRGRGDRLLEEGGSDHGPARQPQRQEGQGLAHLDGEGRRRRGQQERPGEPGAQGREPDRRRAGDRVDDAAGARRDGARQGAEGEARDQARLRGPQRGRREGDRLADVDRERRDEGLQGGPAPAQPGRACRACQGVADAEERGRRSRRDGAARKEGRSVKPGRPRADGARVADCVCAGREGERAGRDRRLGPAGKPEPARGRGQAGPGVGNADVRRLGRDARAGARAQAPGQCPGCEARRGRERLGPPGADGGRVAHAEHHAGRADLPGREAQGREAHGWVSPWDDAVLIPCTDGTARRIGRGVFPLAHGLPRNLGRGGTRQRIMARLAGLDAPSLAQAKRNRIGRLKGYGNAINPWVAAQWIMAYLEARGW